MSRQNIFKITISLSLTTLICLLGLILTVRAATITVCASGCDYTTIQAAVSAASSGDTLNILAGIYAENITISGKNLTLQGAGVGSTIVDGNQAARVFIINNGSNATISDMMITNGDGGIHVLAPNTVLTLTNSIVGNNISTNSGGGILIANGTVVLNNCGIRNNSAPHGGGIFVSSSVSDSLLRAKDSDISSNTASGNGGGIFSWRRVILTNSTVSNNTANDNGGAIFSIGSGAFLTLKNSTVAHNIATGNAGGIYNQYFSTADLQNTIIASQNSGNDCENEGAINSLGHNLDSDGSCALTATGDQPNTNPFLGPLQDNGGFTWTHALLPDSPAIDAGSCSGITTDQRGFPRPVDVPAIANVDDGCDIGAYEFGSLISIYLPVVLK